MPLETIHCDQCGSSDVTEFKPGSYVCAHCEALFKHVPSGAASSGGCEVDACGVPAIARCATCRRRYCQTHQARQSDGVPYVDLCADCQAQRLANFQADQAKTRDYLLGIADSTERQVVAAAVLCTGHELYVWFRPGGEAVWQAIFNEPPGYGGALSDNAPPWDSEHIARWFAARASDVGLKPDEALELAEEERPRFWGSLGMNVVSVTRVRARVVHVGGEG
jgi:hypothetical protein